MANPTGPARCDGHTGAARRAHLCTVWERYVKCENKGEWRNFAVAHSIKTYQTNVCQDLPHSKLKLRQ